MEVFENDKKVMSLLRVYSMGKVFYTFCFKGNEVLRYLEKSCIFIVRRKILLQLFKNELKLTKNKFRIKYGIIEISISQKFFKNYIYLILVQDTIVGKVYKNNKYYKGYRIIYNNEMEISYEVKLIGVILFMINLEQFE